MSETYIVTGKAREALDALLAGLTPVETAPADRATMPARKPERSLSEIIAFRNRVWAMGDYPAPPEGLVRILTAAIVSWEQEAASEHTPLEAAATFRACAWELRQILNDFPEPTSNDSPHGGTDVHPSP